MQARERLEDRRPFGPLPLDALIAGPPPAVVDLGHAAFVRRKTEPARRGRPKRQWFRAALYSEGAVDLARQLDGGSAAMLDHAGFQYTWDGEHPPDNGRLRISLEQGRGGTNLVGGSYLTRKAKEYAARGGREIKVVLERQSEAGAPPNIVLRLHTQTDEEVNALVRTARGTLLWSRCMHEQVCTWGDAGRYAHCRVALMCSRRRLLRAHAEPPASTGPYDHQD